MKRKILLSVILSLFGLNCSTLKKSSINEQDTLRQKSVSEKLLENPSITKIDIYYTLDKQDFRLTLSSDANSAVGKSFLEKKLLKSKSLNKSRYFTFLKKAADLTETYTGNINSSEPYPVKSPIPCRTPFTIKIQLESSQYIGRGCRSTDGGSFSRLVNEGEFLLYSGNPAL